jgi:hypothetical protein
MAQQNPNLGKSCGKRVQSGRTLFLTKSLNRAPLDYYVEGTETHHRIEEVSNDKV